MTNGQLRGSLLTMQVALNKVQGEVFSGDDTPNNLDNQRWWRNASEQIETAQTWIPSDSDAPGETAVRLFNDANVAYKTFTSTYSEFGHDEWPSFADAVWESVQELPENVGEGLAAIPNGVGNILKRSLGSFFGNLGFMGWLILIAAGLALLTYIYPQWTLAARGLLYK